MAGASRTKLEPGEDSTGRARPRKSRDGSYRLQWNVALYDGRTLRRSTQGPTISAVRHKAKRKVAELLQTSGRSWKLDTQLTKYIDAVTRPALDEADLRPLTRDAYDSALKMLLGECTPCTRRQDRHRFGLKQYTIGAGIRARPLSKLLTEIAQRHGPEKAHACRTVLNTYIITPLIIDDLIPRNPISGLNLTHPPGAKEPAHTRGGRSMDRADYSAFLTWLLDLDPASLAPTRGPRLQPHWRDLTVAKWHNAIDLSLLQMATGLRQTEGRRLTWPLLQVDDQGVMSIKIPKDVAKTRDARVVLVLEPRVAKRLLERRDRAGGIGYVIGAPSDPTKVWHRSNCGAAVAALYQRAATELGIDVLLTERSHMWRTTLRTFYQGQAPDAVLNAQFGHSQEIADKHYTDYRRLDDLADAAGLGTSQQPQATAPLRHPSPCSKSCLGLLFDLLFRPLSGPFARGLSPHPTDASSLGPLTRDRRA